MRDMFCSFADDFKSANDREGRPIISKQTSEVMLKVDEVWKRWGLVKLHQEV
jgi:hypothetical protein